MGSAASRTLRLIGLLQTRRVWAGAELAERLGVDRRSLRRDIERLRALGYAVQASSGVGGGYRLAAGAQMLPLLFEDDEAVTVAVALRAAAASMGGLGPVNAIGIGHVAVCGAQAAVRGAAAGWRPVQAAHGRLGAAHGNPKGRAWARTGRRHHSVAY